MSKKDRERYEKEGTVHRDGKLVKKEICAYPPCQNHVSPHSKLGLCQTCDYVINLVAWFDKAMATAEQQKRQGPILVVPKPGMERQAIREAIEKQKKGG